MNEYDEECLQVFLEKQLQLFQEEVATTPEEAEEFLSDCMAVICKDLKDVKAVSYTHLDVYKRQE